MRPRDYKKIVWQEWKKGDSKMQTVQSLLDNSDNHQPHFENTKFLIKMLPRVLSKLRQAAFLLSEEAICQLF